MLNVGPWGSLGACRLGVPVTRVQRHSPDGGAEYLGGPTNTIRMNKGDMYG